MTNELKTSLDQLLLLINNWNRGRIAKEEIFIDDLRPLILKVKAEIEKPQGVQSTIEKEEKV